MATCVGKCYGQNMLYALNCAVVISASLGIEKKCDKDWSPMKMMGWDRWPSPNLCGDNPCFDAHIVIRKSSWNVRQWQPVPTGAINRRWWEIPLRAKLGSWGQHIHVPNICWKQTRDLRMSTMLRMLTICFFVSNFAYYHMVQLTSQDASGRIQFLSQR